MERGEQHAGQRHGGGWEWEQREERRQREERERWEERRRRSLLARGPVKEKQ